MTTTISRRDFAATVLAGVGAAALPSLVSGAQSRDEQGRGAAGSAQARNLKIGCTSLIWGALPRSPDHLASAVKDMASLGFHGFETFAAILEEWDKRGTIGQLLAAHRIPLVSVYATMQVVDPMARKEELEKLKRWATLLRKHGGRFI